MFVLKCFLLVVFGLILTASATPIQYGTLLDPQFENKVLYKPKNLYRRIRSPGHGSVDMDIRKDQSGRQASVSYNQNIFTSKDGRGTIDAYAQASRNFDHNHNDFSGGIKGSWKF